MCNRDWKCFALSRHLDDSCRHAPYYNAPRIDSQKIFGSGWIVRVAQCSLRSASVQKAEKALANERTSDDGWRWPTGNCELPSTKMIFCEIHQRSLDAAPRRAAVLLCIKVLTSDVSLCMRLTIGIELFITCVLECNITNESQTQIKNISNPSNC